MLRQTSLKGRQLFVRCTVFAGLAAFATLAACADSLPGRSLAPSTPSLGKNTSASSPSILFAGDVDEIGNYEVYSMNADGTGIARLTHSTGIDMFPVWSPDGKRIAFMSDRNRPGFGDIYVMNADGTNVVQLTTSAGMNSMPSWSKDGKQIVFSSTRDAANPALFNMADYELYVMNADGTNVRRVTNSAGMDAEAVWSADGRQIAFLSGRDHPGTAANDLYVMNVDGTNVVRLTNQTIDLAYISWDPHSRRIAFSLDPDSPDAGIYTILPDGTGQQRITTTSPTTDIGPSWSPDGAKIAYTCAIGGLSQVCVVNADGTGRTQLTSGPGVHTQVRWTR